MDTYTLSYPKFFQLNFLIWIPISGFMTFFFWSFHPLLPIIFGVLSLYTIISFFSYSIKIEYNNDGITIKQVFRPENSIYWNDIHKIKNKMFGEGMAIFDTSGKKLFSINKYLEGSEHFNKMLSEKRSDLLKTSLDEKISANTFFIIGITALFFIVGITSLRSTLSQNISFSCMLEIVFLGIGIYLFLALHRDVTLESDRLILRSLFKTTEYHLSNIKTIDLSVLSSVRTKGYKYVTIHHLRGKPTPIYLLGRSKFIVYHHLRNWFDTQKTKVQPQLDRKITSLQKIEKWGEIKNRSDS